MKLASSILKERCSMTQQPCFPAANRSTFFFAGGADMIKPISTACGPLNITKNSRKPGKKDRRSIRAMSLDHLAWRRRRLSACAISFPISRKFGQLIWSEKSYTIFRKNRSTCWALFRNGPGIKDGQFRLRERKIGKLIAQALNLL